MIKIAICDDQSIEIKRINEILQMYLKTRDIVAEIDIYLLGNQLLRSEKEYDIIFMDIELKDENGIEIIKKYNQIKHSLVIFVTAHDEESVTGYEVKAFRFLIKPLEQTLFYRVMDAAIEEINSQKRLMVLDQEHIVVIKDTVIVYVEAGSRSVGIRTEKGFYKLNETINKLYKQLNPLKFFMPHRSYIINMNFV